MFFCLFGDGVQVLARLSRFAENHLLTKIVEGLGGKKVGIERQEHGVVGCCMQMILNS